MTDDNDNDNGGASSTTTTSFDPNTNNNSGTNRLRSSEDVVQAQLQSLDDTDVYATQWKQVKDRYRTSNSSTTTKATTSTFKWGGRGQGGRGTSRRTFQIRDVVVKDGVRLEYVGSSSSSLSNADSTAGASAVAGSASSRLLLENATLKLLSSHVYALVGRNGTGKSTLLKRLRAGNIPGVPPWIRSLYVGQDDEFNLVDGVMNDPFTNEGIVLKNDENEILTPITYLERRIRSFRDHTSGAVQQSVDELEKQMEALDVENDAELFEKLSEQLSALDDQLQQEDEEVESSDGTNRAPAIDRHIVEALDFMGVPVELRDSPVSAFSPGIRQKLCLAAALVCPCDLLLLDEPSKELDVPGLLQLRSLITEVSEQRSTTVLMVSHDLDLVNDVATDIIQLSHLQLQYTPGNYDDYLAHQRQIEIRDLRQVLAVEKKSEHMHQTLDNLKQQVASRKGGGPGSKKQSKQVSAHKKKMEHMGVVATGGEAAKSVMIGSGATTVALSMEASARRGLTPSQLLELMEQRKRPPPDRTVQFIFRDPKSTWGEPLIVATDVFYRYPENVGASSSRPNVKRESEPLLKTDEGNVDVYAPPPPRPGYVLDSIDLCIEEGRTYCIVGEAMSGKSTLLRLLAKKEGDPTEGTIQHALGLDVGLLDARTTDRMMGEAGANATSANALSYLSQLYPTKSENQIRGELSNFGLSPQQAATSLRFLSGGEFRRLCLAAIMLKDPQVIVLDQPTSDLDMESVEALIYGLKRWKGTVIMASHDASFVRELEAQCYALVDHRLFRVEGGIDAYLRAYDA